jgi:type VI secretion system secreted protein Hcp
MEYKLTNAIISSVSVGGSNQGLPIESVGFNYGKIEWKYTIQKREGGGGGGNTAGSWNLQTNATK